MSNQASPSRTPPASPTAHLPGSGPLGRPVASSAAPTIRLAGATAAAIEGLALAAPALIAPPAGESGPLPEEMATRLADFTAWLGERSGEEIPAPTSLAGELEVLGDAPGTYVFDK